MKTIRIGLLLAISGAASAQVYTPPAPGSNNRGTPTDTTTTVNRQQPDSKSPFGEEIPLLNPGDETVTVAGITIPLGDNRILRARFEKYLSQPAESSEAAKEYRSNIDQILADLSPYRKEGPDIRAAFKTLPAAAAAVVVREVPQMAHGPAFGAKPSAADSIARASAVSPSGPRLNSKKLRSQKGWSAQSGSASSRGRVSGKLGKVLVSPWIDGRRWSMKGA